MEQEYEDEGDRNGTCDRWEVVSGSEEALALEELLVEDYGDDEGEDRLGRDHTEHVVEVVSKADGEVGSSHPIVGEQLPVVGQSDRIGVEDRRQAVPVTKADPDGGNDRYHQENDQAQHGRRTEHPAQPRLFLIEEGPIRASMPQPPLLRIGRSGDLDGLDRRRCYTGLHLTPPG